MHSLWKMQLIAMEIGKEIIQNDSQEDLPALPKLAVTICLLKQPIVQLPASLTKRHGPLSNSSTLAPSRSALGSDAPCGPKTLMGSCQLRGLWQSRMTLLFRPGRHWTCSAVLL